MQFTGRLTDDAKVRTVKDDKKVTGFTVALNKRFKSKGGEKREKTAYVVCSYWINPGLAEFLKKGTIVEINGWMEAQPWANRDGDPQATLTCSIDTVKLFGRPSDKPAEKAGASKTKSKATTSGAPDEDDMPF